MKRFFLAALLAFGLASAAHAQVAQNYWNCGTSPNGQLQWCPVSSAYPIPTSGGGSGGGTSINGSGGTSTGGIALESRIPSSAASTNTTVAKVSGGRVYKVIACNTSAAPIYVKFYNATSPTVGTTPVVFSRLIPSGTAASPGCASYDQQDIGWAFTGGISYAFTTGTLDSDTTAIAAGAIIQSSVEYQ